MKASSIAQGTTIPFDDAAPIDEGAALPLACTDVLEQGWFAGYLVHFIASADVLNFAACCRRTRVVRLAPSNPWITTNKTWKNDASRYSAWEWQHLRLAQQLSGPCSHRVHTVFLKCEWKDQGWGNRKGMLSVVSDEGKAPNDSQPWSAAVVCGKEPAPHQWEKLSLSFCALRFLNDGTEHTYRLCARAGGGGGHALSVRQLIMRELLLVESTPEAQQSFDALVAHYSEARDCREATARFAGQGPSDE